MDHPHPTPPPEDVGSTSLDALVPPPMGTIRRLAVGALLVVIASALAIGHAGGWFVPRPTDGSSFGSDSALRVDRGRGVVAARVLFPNGSRRTVRVTSVSLDAPGARLVSVEATRPSSLGTDGAPGGRAEVTTRSGTGTPPSRALPVRIPPGQQVELILWLRPERCEAVEAPWGIAAATVDFGPGAVPPVSRRVVLEQDPIWTGGVARAASAGGSTDEVGRGPLALACEVLR